MNTNLSAVTAFRDNINDESKNILDGISAMEQRVIAETSRLNGDLNANDRQSQLNVVKSIEGTIATELGKLKSQLNLTEEQPAQGWQVPYIQALNNYQSEKYRVLSELSDQLIDLQNQIISGNNSSQPTNEPQLQNESTTNTENTTPVIVSSSSPDSRPRRKKMFYIGNPAPVSANTSTQRSGWKKLFGIGKPKKPKQSKTGVLYKPTGYSANIEKNVSGVWGITKKLTAGFFGAVGGLIAADVGYKAIRNMINKK